MVHSVPGPKQHGAHNKKAQQLRQQLFNTHLLLHSAQALGRDQVPASLQTIAVKTGLSKSAVQVALRHLKRRGLIGADDVGTQVNPVRQVLRPWRRRLEMQAAA